MLTFAQLIALLACLVCIDQSLALSNYDKMTESLITTDPVRLPHPSQFDLTCEDNAEVKNPFIGTTVDIYQPPVCPLRRGTITFHLTRHFVSLEFALSGLFG